MHVVHHGLANFGISALTFNNIDQYSSRSRTIAGTCNESMVSKSNIDFASTKALPVFVSSTLSKMHVSFIYTTAWCFHRETGNSTSTTNHVEAGGTAWGYCKVKAHFVVTFILWGSFCFACEDVYLLPPTHNLYRMVDLDVS